MSIDKHFLYTDKFKTNVVCILFRRNLEKHEVTKNSLLANILSNGSEKYPTIKDIYTVIENMYGAVFDVRVIKKSEEHIYQFYFEFIDNDERKLHLKKSLDFLMEIIYNPLINENGFDENYFKLEKENLKEDIRAKINDKSEYAKDKCIEIMCANERFGIDGEGYLEELDKIENHNLLSHYKEVLNTSPINLILMGNYEEEFVNETFANYFSFEREEITRIIPIENYYIERKPMIHKEETSISQSKITMGIRVKEAIKGKELYSLLLFNSIFGGGADSKLFKNIREDKNLAYYIYSLVYRYKSIILVECGVDLNEIEKTTRLIMEELEEFRGGGFKTRDLEKAKMNLINNFEMIDDSQGRTIDFYVSQILADDKMTIDECIKIVEDITIGDIINTSQDMFIDTIFYLKGAE